MIPVDVAQDDIVDIGGLKASFGEGSHDVGFRPEGCPRLHVRLDSGRVASDVLSHAKVEDEAGRPVIRGVLDEERHGRNGLDGF